MKSLPLFLLNFIIFFVHVKAQIGSDSSETMPSDDDSVSNFQPSLAVVVGILSIMFSITFTLLLYAKFCHRASSTGNTSRQVQNGLTRSNSNASGVDKTVIESLPFFRFSLLKGSREGLECAVCLAKFEDTEILRLLPKCKHGFHIDCIDQWLEKHSTCPLCRHKVNAEDLSQLPYSNSLRFLSNETEFREESNLELYIQREENRHGSSKFSIGNSFRKLGSNKEEELPIQRSMDREENGSSSPLHKFNHKIVVSDVVLKNRWSNVSSSDLMFLNSEMINDISSERFSSLDMRTEQKSVEISSPEENDQGMSIKEELDRKLVFENKFREIKESERGSFAFPGIPVNFESKVINSNEKRSMSEIVVHPRFRELKNRDSVLVQNNVKEERLRRVWLPIARKTVQWFANRERRPPRSQDLEQATHV